MSQFSEEPLSSSAEAGFGYFPVSPSQTLKNGHYKVIRKLGWGPRLSAWLATYQDEETGTEYCVIKILTVHATNEQQSRRWSSREVQVHKAVKCRGFHYLPIFHDSFTESSAHGDHLCIVTSSILSDIDTTMRMTAPDKYLPLHIVKKIIVSVIDPLGTVHGAGIFHGAVKPDNFSFAITTMPKFLEPRLAKLPPMDSRPAVVVDGIEYPIIISQPLLHNNSWEDDRADVADYSVYLNNLGHAMRVNKTARWDTRNPTSLRPPEVILGASGASLTHKVDVWMLGCATFLLLTGEPLFTPEPQDDADHLARIMKLTGETFDSPAWKEFPRYDEFFLQSGQPKTDLTNNNHTLEERLRSLSRLSEDDVKPAAEFIACCLKVDPAKRTTLHALEDHEWLAGQCECSCGYSGCM